MKRRFKYTAGVLAAAILGGTFLYYYGGSRTPSGQPPLERLGAGNATGVRNAFNAARDQVRVLQLLSPT